MKEIDFLFLNGNNLQSYNKNNYKNHNLVFRLNYDSKSTFKQKNKKLQILYQKSEHAF